MCAATHRRADPFAIGQRAATWYSVLRRCSQCSTMISQASTGDLCERTTLWNVFCAKCDEERAVGAFPDGKSALMLAAARLRHVAGTKWGRGGIWT